MGWIPLLTLAAVFVLIAIRQVGSVRLPIWVVMLAGAAVVLLTGQIGLSEALAAINVDVLVLLFGMFVLGQALEWSGYLSHLSYRLFKRAPSADVLVLAVIFGSAVASALLMNDTLAVIGTPVMLLLSRKHGVSAKMLLLALAFSITLGSVVSPIGNPQNLLVALHSGLSDPFGSFLRFLLLPTLVNLILTFLLLRHFYPGEFHSRPLRHEKEPLEDERMARWAKIGLLIVVALVLVKLAIAALHLPFDFPLTWVALAGALPVLLLSRRRLQVLKRVDWPTLVFFAAMFVLVQSVWLTGFFQSLLTQFRLDVAALPVIFGVSVVLSQFISNVPLVALYLPLLAQVHASAVAYLALAAASTIAGNLFILGAASNVIIVQNAESRGHEGLTFWEFARIGVPLTALNVAVYWLFLGFAG